MNTAWIAPCTSTTKVVRITPSISRLPSRLDCLERGGQADSLYRYCIGPAGTDRLREDVMFRFYEALPVLVVVFIVAGVVHHYLRTHRKNATPPG